MKMNPHSTEWNSSSEGLVMSTTPTSSARTADRTVSAHNLSSRKGKNPGSTHSASNEDPFGDSADLAVTSNHLTESSLGKNTGDISTEMTTGQPTQDYASSSRGSSSSSSSKKLQQYHHHHSTDNGPVSVDERVEDNTNHIDETQNQDSRRSSKHTRTTRPSKYKDTDVKRMESSRRRSRSRSQDRSRRSAGSQDPSRQRRSKSRDATETNKRRSRSQDPLATAQQRLDERRRSKSQDPNGEEHKPAGGGEEEAAAARPVRQGRRPTRPSKGTIESTSSRNVTTTTLPTTVSPLPMETTATTATLPDPILQQYLGEGMRAFDYILGLEPPTTTTDTPGNKSTERTGTGTPMSNAMLSLASPQLPKKSFEPTNNPHVSPTIFFNSMAKKVAGDRWLQDESIRSRRSSDPVASPRKSLGDQLMALSRDSFNANTLDPDEKSMHSQDLTPQLPRRRGSKRLAGTRPKPAEPPFSSTSDIMSNDGSSTTTNNNSHSVTGSVPKSPHKQIRKLANKVVKSSKSMLQGENNNTKTPPSSFTNRNVMAPSHQPLCDKTTDHTGLDDPSSDSKSSSSSWLVHDDGALTPRTLKRRSTLQKARDKVTTLLKTSKKPSQMPDVWGALEDSDSVEISDVDDEVLEKGIFASPLQPFTATSPQFDVKNPPQDVNLVRETTPSPPPPPSPPLSHDYCSPTPSRRIKSKAASEQAEEHEVIPSDPEKHPLRKSSTRKPRRSSSPSRRARSSSPNSSKSNPTSSTVRRKSRSIQEKHDSESRASSNSKGRRSQSLTKHEESVGTTGSSGGGGGDEEGTTSQERRRRSRSESRPEAHVGMSRDDSHGGGDSRRSKNQTRPSSSREVTRSNSPHSLRSATMTMKERKPRPMSNSPGNYRREGSKRREALQKIRSERSVKSLNLAETTTTSTTTSVSTEHSGSTKTGPGNDPTPTVKGSRRQNTSSRSVTSGDVRVSSVRSMDPNLMRDYDRSESVRNERRKSRGDVDHAKGWKNGASEVTASINESIPT